MRAVRCQRPSKTNGSKATRRPNQASLPKFPHMSNHLNPGARARVRARDEEPSIPTRVGQCLRLQANTASAVTKGLALVQPCATKRSSDHRSSVLPFQVPSPGASMRASRQVTRGHHRQFACSASLWSGAGAAPQGKDACKVQCRCRLPLESRLGWVPQGTAAELLRSEM